MTSDEKKGVISVTILCGLIASFIFQNQFVSLFQIVLPFLPIIAYGLVGLMIRDFLWQIIPANAKQSEFDRQQTASLTLTGFCFTSLSLLASFFKEEIKRGEQQPKQIIFFFSCALIAFIASYTILRFRIRSGTEYCSDALVDNGLWCILVGMWTFFDLNHTSKIAYLFVGMLLFFGFCVMRNLYYYATFTKATAEKPQST